MLHSELFTDDKVDLKVLKERALGMRWAGMPEGTIPLTSADPDFKPAIEIREAMTDFIKGGYFPYAPDALPGLREAISGSLKMRKNEDVPPEFIQPVDSASACMHAIALSVLKPGDEVIIFDPVDLLFGISARYAGATVVYYSPKHENGHWDFSDLESYVTDKTRMIGLCNPHNPLGLLYTEGELRTIATVAAEHDLWIMNDEIWSDIIYSERPFVSINSLGPELNKKTISFYGFSKGFALPGLRAGYLYTLNAEAFETAMHRCYDLAAGVDYLTQIAMKTAVTDCWYWVDAFVERLQSNRDYLVERMNAMPLLHAPKPEATFVSFFDVRETGMSSQEFADYSKEHCKVALVPGTVKWFGPGGEGNVRLCYSTSHAILKEALDRIEAGMQELAGKL